MDLLFREKERNVSRKTSANIVTEMFADPKSADPKITHRSLFALRHEFFQLK